MADAYRNLIASYRVYWRLYGGGQALITSPYLHLAVVLTCISYPMWSTAMGAQVWPSCSIDILPSMIGFSIAGMAIFLAFSTPKMIGAVTEDGRPDSFFVTTVVNFFHFVMVQCLALLLGIGGMYYSFTLLSALGVFGLIYATLVALAMTMHLLHAARIINAATSIPDGADEPPT